MYKLVISNHNDIYYNLALESYLLSLKEEIIFLWINSPSVVIGYNQNVYKEVNLTYLKEHNICLARRLSGGGCVYHDLNNLNVSLITKEDNEKKLNEIIKDVLSLFNIKTVISSNNDLLINDLKFSGQAGYQENTMSLYHSCIMVDVNLENLTKSITPSMLKLHTHAVDSVKKRVVNLKSINEDININSLVAAFKKLPYIIDTNIFLDDDKIKSLKEKYQSKDFIYSNNPYFSYKEELIINNDIFDILMDIKDNQITKMKIYTDSLNVFNFKNIYDKYLNSFFNLDLKLQLIEDIKKLYK